MRCSSVCWVLGSAAGCLIIVLKELSNDSGANTSKFYVESFGDCLGEEDGKGPLAVGAGGAELSRGMLVEPD